MDSILAFLESRKTARIALGMHQRPDGDALGSAMGLADMLRRCGHDVKVFSSAPLPDNLSFIVNPSLVLNDAGSGWWRDFDCFGVLDCGEIGRLEESAQEIPSYLPTFTIDHHASSAGVGQAIWLEPEASSTGEMVIRLANRAGWSISPFAAQALWTALITDTGCFCYENTSPTAMEAARDCLRAGASPSLTATKLYQSVSVPERRLQLLVLERMEVLAGGRLAVSWLTGDDFVRAGIGVEGAQNLVNLLRDTAGVEVAIFLYEPGGASAEPQAVKASFRTRSPHDALAVTRRYGGGGHQRAAGCSLPGPIAKAKQTMLEAALGEYFRDSAGEPPAAIVRIVMP